MITKEVAEQFMQECAGGYSGHMSNIPNNPGLMPMMLAHGLTDSNYYPSRTEFARFLREVASRLER